MPRKQNSAEVRPAPPAALYLHVPFCLRKCRYCDFYSVDLEGAPADRYVRAARAELAARRDRTAPAFRTVFVGGGTPTSLGERRLPLLLADLAGPGNSAVEFSVEANPGTVNAAVVAALAECGVNRITLGAQSFDEGELSLLGRIHTPGETVAAVQAVRRAGIDNLGLDLIYGIPAQTEDSWRASLAAALALDPEHLSCYGLSIEEGTPLEEDVRAGRVRVPEEAMQRACYDAAIEAAASAGLEHYEISNFARPGRRCLHNLTYWDNDSYIGIGPGAVSYVDNVRRANLPDLAAYLRAVEAGLPPPAREERPGPRTQMAETMMVGLRRIEGIGRGDFRRRFGMDPAKAFPRSLSRHAELGSLHVTSERIRIAPGYFFVSDSVLADIVGEAADAPRDR
jgi:oxygen-independent coproporphyrinogen III oxidase